MNENDDLKLDSKTIFSKEMLQALAALEKLKRIEVKFCITDAEAKAKKIEGEMIFHLVNDEGGTEN